MESRIKRKVRTKASDELYAWIPALCGSNDLVKHEILSTICDNTPALPKATTGPKNAILQLLVRASRAHWATDFQEMNQVQEIARTLSASKSDSFVMEELCFLMDSVLGADFDQPAPLIQLTEPKTNTAHNQETQLRSLWQALIWAGARLSQGRYQDAVTVLRHYLPFAHRFPAAYRLRVSIILGICHQAMGQYQESYEELTTQQRILLKFPSRVLEFALQRRRLSFALETEDLQSARTIGRQMETQAALIQSPFLLTLFYQEKIKLSLSLSDGLDIGSTQEIQESLLAKSKIPAHVIIPLEERCEAALLAQKPRNALKIVSKQAWLSRENGLINGQLIAAMILFQCQVQLGHIQAARITVNELKYLCKQYRFGRDELRARILEAIWFLGNDGLSTYTGHGLLDSAQQMAQGLGLKVHLWAIYLFRCFLGPTRENLQSAFDRDRQSIDEFRAALLLVNKWLILMKQQSSQAFQFVRLLLSESRPFTFVSLGFPECGSWIIVTFSTADYVQFETAHFAHGSMHDMWLRLLLSSKEPIGLSELHTAIAPRVSYTDHRHRSSTLIGLQKLRAKLRTSFTHYLKGADASSRYFGLRNEEQLRLFPAPNVWTCKPLNQTEQISRASRRFIKESQTQLLAADHQRKRNNAPKLQSTIQSKSDRITAWLEAHGPSSGSEMSLGMGLARKSLHFYLKRLVELRIVSLSGLGRNAVYSLTSKII
jgi:hypothetical protein